ncbi:hypothetical protein, partial [Streptomyces collinus]|uniref:hypothetical protein n=1 Tax=Streptomyces collinus TaxID=42684 RepID=UPI0036A439AF
HTAKPGAHPARSIHTAANPDQNLNHPGRLRVPSTGYPQPTVFQATTGAGNDANDLPTSAKAF